MMKTCRTRKAAPTAAALGVVAGVLLAECSSGDGSTTQAPSVPSPTVSTARFPIRPSARRWTSSSSRALGVPERDGGACLARAARKAGMAEEALAHIVKADSDDMGAVIDGLNKVGADDAALLASRSLR